MIMNDENNHIYQLTDEVIRGLKAKLIYQSCDLVCTPLDRCECDNVTEDIRAAEEWISHLPGTESFCDG
tara:strand:- start:271 stop:477 length:207 start_codon:yes stop_codon:yes gene_type:complete